MEHPDRATAERAGAVVAQLQQSVQAWLDADQILPADGQSLLAMLDFALTGRVGASAAAASAMIEAVIERTEALIEAGTLGRLTAAMPSNRPAPSSPRAVNEVTTEQCSTMERRKRMIRRDTVPQTPAISRGAAETKGNSWGSRRAVNGSGAGWGWEFGELICPFSWLLATGVMTWTVDGNPIDVGPGQALCIPRVAIHRFDNNGHEDVKALCVITPAAIGPQYFREAAEVINAAAGGPPDVTRMAEIMIRHGLTPAPPRPQVER